MYAVVETHYKYGENCVCLIKEKKMRRYCLETIVEYIKDIKDWNDDGDDKNEKKSDNLDDKKKNIKKDLSECIECFENTQKNLNDDVHGIMIKRLVDKGALFSEWVKNFSEVCDCRDEYFWEWGRLEVTQRTFGFIDELEQMEAEGKLQDVTYKKGKINYKKVYNYVLSELKSSTPTELKEYSKYSLDYLIEILIVLGNVIINDDIGHGVTQIIYGKDLFLIDRADYVSC